MATVENPIRQVRVMTPNVSPYAQSCPRSTRQEFDWQAQLPREWRDMVVAPLFFEQFEEPSAHARRCVGRDEDDGNCFVRMQFALYNLRCDDDDVFYEVLDYREVLNAWRLRDGRWLILREIHHGADCSKPQRFFSLGETCPR